MDLYDRVRLAREGTAVERCHVHPHRQRYSVGHHSLDLVTLITLCWIADHDGELPDTRLLIAAAFHDIPERITGDLPQPIKVRLLGDVVGKVEDSVMTALGVDVTLTPEEQRYLKWGDKLELWFWSWEQVMQGDIKFDGWIQAYNKRFSENGDQPDGPPPSYLHLMSVVTKECMMSRLDEYELLRGFFNE